MCLYAQTLKLSSSMLPCPQLLQCWSRLQPQSWEVGHWTHNADSRETSNTVFCSLSIVKRPGLVLYPPSKNSDCEEAQCSMQITQKRNYRSIHNFSKKCISYLLLCNKWPQPIRSCIFFTINLNLIFSKKPSQASRNPTLCYVSS